MGTGVDSGSTRKLRGMGRGGQTVTIRQCVPETTMYTAPYRVSGFADHALAFPLSYMQEILTTIRSFLVSS